MSSKSVISTGLHVVTLLKLNLFYYTGQTISEAADFEEWGCLQKTTHAHFWRLFISKIIIRARVVHNTYILSWAPWSFATHFGLILTYVTFYHLRFAMVAWILHIWCNNIQKWNISGRLNPHLTAGRRGFNYLYFQFWALLHLLHTWWHNATIYQVGSILEHIKHQTAHWKRRSMLLLQPHGNIRRPHLRVTNNVYGSWIRARC